MGFVLLLERVGRKLVVGIDANEKVKRTSKFQLKGPRIWLPLDVLQGAAYAGVSTSAKALLLDLSAQLRAKHSSIYNNGDLTTAMAVLSNYGWKSDKTIRGAAKQLEQANLIVKTRQGCLPNKANLYAVTWLPLNENRKLDVMARSFPFKSYLLKDKLPVIKKLNG